MRRDRPGYQEGKRKGRIVHYWNPKRAVKGCPESLGIIALPDNLTDEQIAAECQRLTAELRREVMLAGQGPVYDGTIGSLARIYMRDPHSPYRAVKHTTKLYDYQPSLMTLERDVGKRRIDKVKASDIRGWWQHWLPRGHRRAQGVIKLLRVILTYGTGERLHGCAELRAILSALDFPAPPKRDVMMTYEQAKSIVEAAIAAGRPSIAMTTALQFETALRRIDIIGEWEGREWRPGLLWQQVDAGQVLRLKTSKTGAVTAFDLSALPLVQLALDAYPRRDLGPLIINETTGRPWHAARYYAAFQIVREKAGVPAEIRSMDARAGAITEARDATGSIDDARHLATHSDAKMTERYIRADPLDRNRAIAELRVNSRSETAVKHCNEDEG